MARLHIDKHISLYKTEADMLKKKAEATGLTESALMRRLIRGYEPKEKPDARFYEMMRELSAIGNNINQLAAKANSLGFIDALMLKNEAKKWAKFQTKISKRYLSPDDTNVWQ